MPKNPYEVLTDLSKGHYERYSKLLEFGHTQTDTLSGWIIGLGVAALSLLATKTEELHKTTPGAAKPLVIFLVLSICFGLAYRYLSYHMTILHKNLADYFAGVFSDATMTPTAVDPELDTASFEEIIISLKNDFNVEIPYPTPLNDNQKAVELPRLREYYKALCAHSKKLYDMAVDHWAGVIETAYKINKETFKKRAKNPKVGFRLRRWAFIAGTLYLLCILSFIAAVIITGVYLYYAL